MRWGSSRLGLAPLAPAALARGARRSRVAGAARRGAVRRRGRLVRGRGRRRAVRRSVARALDRRGRRPGAARPAVGLVEAAALEGDPDRTEDLAQIATAVGALRERVVGERLDDL